MSDKDPEEPSSSHGPLIGIIFVVALALTAMYLINRMQHSATMADCMFTRDPKCREMMNR